MLETKIEELIAAVSELTETMRAFAAAAPASGGGDDDSGGDTEEKPKRTRRSKKETPPDDDDAVTLEDVREVGQRLADIDASLIKTVLKKFKLGKLSDAKPAQFAEIKAAFEAAIEEAGEEDGEDDDLL